MKRFSPDVADRLKCYVYRLIDPRDGQTFYVGRGQGDRVFAHARGELDPDRNMHAMDPKLDLLHDIRIAGLRPIHLIHRHGMNERTAKVVEAALIDAFPGLTNKVKGADARLGPRTVEQLEENYAPTVMVRNPKHRLILIKTKPESVKAKGNLYEAVRRRWTLDPDKARRADYVLAVVDQTCTGVFVADEWRLCSGYEARPKKDQKWEFIGRETNDEEAHAYVRKRLPYEYRKQGMARPVLHWPFADDPIWLSDEVSTISSLPVDEEL